MSRIVPAMLIAHFLKRDLEVLFLHKYSGSAEAGVAVFIGCFYGVKSSVVLWSANLSPVIYGPNVVMGLCLFVIGLLGNLYHHWLLMDLRARASPGGKIGMVKNREYVVPSGAFFDLVTMPHYFFELIGWFGMFVVAPRLNILMVFTGMSSYLIGRSISTTEWYKQRFGDQWPKDRKHIIPFVL